MVLSQWFGTAEKAVDSGLCFASAPVSSFRLSRPRLVTFIAELLLRHFRPLRDVCLPLQVSLHAVGVTLGDDKLHAGAVSLKLQAEPYQAPKLFKGEAIALGVFGQFLNQQFLLAVHALLLPTKADLAEAAFVALCGSASELAIAAVGFGRFGL
jgi:hypothetical protein